jgi:6-phosphofructo-2-kinase
MSYNDIERLYPEEYNARKNNKLYYRFPGMGGESYLDVIRRVNPLIIELERMTDNILIVTHRVVLRILLAYFLDVEKEKVPNIDVPLHTL